MKRLYTVEYYREMLAALPRDRAGRGDHQRLHRRLLRRDGGVVPADLRLVREARFKNSFIFKYSPRPGTKADDLYPDDVPEEVKKRRNNDLLAIQNAISLADHRSSVGQTVEVLVEGPSKTALKHESRFGADAIDRPHDDGPHRRLRRQPAARRADDAGESTRRPRSRCSARW